MTDALQTRATQVAAMADRIMGRGWLHYLVNGDRSSDREKALDLYIKAGKLAELQSAGIALVYYGAAANLVESYQIGSKHVQMRLYFTISKLEYENGGDWLAPARKAETYAVDAANFSEAAKICEWIGDDNSLDRAIKYHKVCGGRCSIRNCLVERARLAVDRGDYGAAATFFAEAADNTVIKYGNMFICEQVLCHLALGDIVAARKLPGYDDVIEAFDEGDSDKFAEALTRQTTRSIMERDIVQQLRTVLEDKMLEMSTDAVL